MSKSINRSISEHVVKRVCVLKPLKNEYQRIELSAGENIIGRKKAIGISDERCSRQQIQLVVDMTTCTVKLKVLGVSPSSINGVMAKQNTCLQLCHRDVIELVYGRYPFEIVFIPSSADNSYVGNDSALNVSVVEAIKNEQWSNVDNGKLVIYDSAGLAPSDKIAAYDLDGTIIKPKSGNVFPINTDDWQIIYSEVPMKLRRLHEDGFKICFFTNQSGISKGKIKLGDFKHKITQIISRLAIPIQVFIAISEGYYRKPMPGMWEHLVAEKNNNVELQLERCFYVGDAAGRPEIGSGIIKRRKDHSLADRLFASNIGISFYTPEEHFLGERQAQWEKPKFEPSSVFETVSLFEPENVQMPASKCEIIIMVGLPGSGKSHFCNELLRPLGYSIVNSDTLGNVEACLKMCEKSLKTGTSCVVDNTNVDRETRAKFIELGKRAAVDCRCFVMNVTVAHVKHQIIFRELTDLKHSKINNMVLNMIKKKYKEPTLEEGFSEIVRVNIKPKFNSVYEKSLYKLYLVEK